MKDSVVNTWLLIETVLINKNIKEITTNNTKLKVIDICKMAILLRFSTFYFVERVFSKRRLYKRFSNNANLFILS